MRPVTLLTCSAPCVLCVWLRRCAAVWWVARLFVSLELCLSSLLHVLVFGNGINLIISRRTAAASTIQSDAAAYGVGGKRE